MFDIGFSEMIALGVIALIAIGPKQLPEVARTIGRLLNELKRATGDLGTTILQARDSTEKQLQEKLADALYKPSSPKPEKTDESNTPS